VDVGGVLLLLDERLRSIEVVWGQQQEEYTHEIEQESLLEDEDELWCLQ